MIDDLEDEGELLLAEPVAVLLPGRTKETMSIVDRALNTSFKKLQFGLQEWVQEVRAVSQLAAASGCFGAALDGYELIGKHMGANINALPANQNHLHIHDADALAEATDAEIMQNIKYIKQQKAALAPQKDAGIEDLM